MLNSADKSRWKGVGMVHIIVLCWLVAIVVSCNILQSQTVQQAEVQKTFAELSQAEKYAYLSAVLKAQGEKIRATRIKRVKSLAEEITHKVELTVQLIDAGFERTKLIRVSWSTVQADSVELLRCKSKDWNTSATVEADTKVVKAGSDFDKLQTDPNAYGFLGCDLVYGRIQNGTSIIDYGAENNFSYVYFLRPCYDNYALAVPASSDTDTKQCGEDKVSAAADSQVSLAKADKQALVFRYCQTDARQVCSAIENRSNTIVFKQGRKKLPLHLFAELRKLRAEIKKHEDALYKEGHAALDELDDSDPLVRAEVFQAQGDKLANLQKEHDAANTRREEKAEAVTYWTGKLGQSMAKRFGHEMSFEGQDCYGASKNVEKEFDRQREDFRKIDEDLKKMLDDDEPATASEDMDMDDEEMEMMMKGLAVGGCVVSNGITAGKLVKVEGLNPFKDEKFKISKNIEELHQSVAWDESTNPKRMTGTGAEFGNAEWGLAAANFAVGMIPAETSELNRGGGVAAFTTALNDILISESAYIREYCRPCLDHMAQARFHSRKIYYLEQRLKILSEQIKRELLEKGAIDPNVP